MDRRKLLSQEVLCSVKFFQFGLAVGSEALHTGCVLSLVCSEAMGDLYPLYDGSDPFETLRNEAEKEDAHDEEQVR